MTAVRRHSPVRRAFVRAAAVTLGMLPLATLAAQSVPVGGSSCTTACHGAESTAFADSVHAEALTCVVCHGGDPSALRDEQASHAAAAGFRGRIERAAVPELCAGCHADPRRMFAFDLPTDQLDHYRTSVHGQRLFEAGDANVAVCTDCHGTHGILASHDPQAPTARSHQPETCGRCHADQVLMDGYGLQSDLVDDFRAGVHGRALLDEGLRGAPACSDCHGSHGATPPGTGSIGLVCGHCHPSTGDAFRHGPHADERSVACANCHDEQHDGSGMSRAGCTACHVAHGTQRPDDALYTGDEVGHCGHCHRGSDPALELAATMLADKQRLRDAGDEMFANLHEAQRLGLFLEDEASLRRELKRSLVALGPLAHTMDAGRIEEQVDAAVERMGQTREDLLRQRRVLRDRRLMGSGLAAVLLMMAALLGAKLSAVRRLS